MGTDVNISVLIFPPSATRITHARCLCVPTFRLRMPSSPCSTLAAELAGVGLSSPSEACAPNSPLTTRRRSRLHLSEDDAVALAPALVRP